MELEKILGATGVIAVLFGLLVLPLLLQEYYRINAVKVAFAIIVVYAAVSWWMKKD